MQNFIRVPGFVALIAVVGAIGAVTPAMHAAAQKKAPAAKTAAPPPPQTVWPLPPDPPRLRFLSTYQGVNDFKTKKKSGRWKSALLGDEEPTGTSETMIEPYGVAVSAKGTIYVTDTAARRVFAFDPDEKLVTFIGESGMGKVAKPVGVAVDEEGRVFVADATLNRVFGYAPDGNFAISIGHDGEMKNPSGLAIDRARKLVYVADATNHQILCYSIVDGASVRTMGKRGSGPGEFNFPTNLFTDSEGRLYVADTLNFRIQIFDADGQFLRSFGTQGDIAGSFNRPKGVAVDSEGHIYVADSSFNNFQIFDQEGKLLLFVGRGGSGPGEFQLPAGLFIDGQDRVYVADQGNSRVQVFQYLRAETK